MPNLRLRKQTKKHRYYDRSGDTGIALEAARRHLHKIGRPLFVKGYLYKRGASPRIRVVVQGTGGSASFSGFSWGFSGTGPRGLVELLISLGVSKAMAQRTAKTPWIDKVGEHWRINFRHFAIAA